MALKLDQFYTYADLLEIDEQYRYELLDGELYLMAAPSLNHQSIVGEIGRQLGNFLRGRECRVFISPVDVRLAAHKRDDTVFQPDVVVVCGRSKFDPRGQGIKGAPDLVVEVLSPATAYRDRQLKFMKYRQSGVREYWIVSSSEKLVDVYLFENNALEKQTYSHADSLPVHVLTGCTIDLTAVFEDALSMMKNKRV